MLVACVHLQPSALAFVCVWSRCQWYSVTASYTQLPHTSVLIHACMRVTGSCFSCVVYRKGACGVWRFALENGGGREQRFGLRSPQVQNKKAAQVHARQRESVSGIIHACMCIFVDMLVLMLGLKGVTYILRREHFD